jgi:CRP-like cAMP-binding protein
MLAAETQPGLEGHIKVVELRQGQILAEPLEKMGRVYFPTSGAVSFSVPLQDGHLVQTGLIGREGAVGALQALDGRVSPNRIVVQVQGEAAVVEAERVAELAQRDPRLRSLFLGHEQFFLAEVQQTAACNAVHSVQEKVARWMLRLNDLIGTDVPLTQEMLSEMIAVRRTSVTGAAAALQRDGLISYKRGHIRIVDIEGLKRASCECYGAVRDHYDRLVRHHD